MEITENVQSLCSIVSSILCFCVDLQLYFLDLGVGAVVAPITLSHRYRKSEIA